MLEEPLEAAWPEWFEFWTQIEWTEPAPHDLLFSGGIREDQTAKLYSIVARAKNEWWPYYIGMTEQQAVSNRLQQSDHVERLERLRSAHPNLNFSVCLGTPTSIRGTLCRDTVGAIEGLLIYANWHEDMDNSRKINRFSNQRQIYVQNTGWTEHLEKEVAYGVLYR